MEIRVKVTPNAKRESLERLPDGRYIASVRAKAEAGAANEDLRELLARKFEVSPKKVFLVRGSTLPNKTFRIEKEKN